MAAELGVLLSDDLDFDVALTGFSISEIDTLPEIVAPEEPDYPKEGVMPAQAPGPVEVEDIWALLHKSIWGVIP